MDIPLVVTYISNIYIRGPFWFLRNKKTGMYWYRKTLRGICENDCEKIWTDKGGASLWDKNAIDEYMQYHPYHDIEELYNIVEYHTYPKPGSGQNDAMLIMEMRATVRFKQRHPLFDLCQKNDIAKKEKQSLFQFGKSKKRKKK